MKRRWHKRCDETAFKGGYMKRQDEQSPISMKKSDDVEPDTQRNTGTRKAARPREEKFERTEPRSSRSDPRNSRVEREINLSSEASFPASDPPSWTPTRAGSPGNGDDDEED